MVDVKLESSVKVYRVADQSNTENCPHSRDPRYARGTLSGGANIDINEKSSCDKRIKMSKASDRLAQNFPLMQYRDIS